MNWKEIIVAPDRTHHLFQGTPLYSQRFQWVLKFHPPGLAPVCDATGAYHINVEGASAYDERHQRTFGFYFDRAAVISKGGWAHIDPTGTFVYKQRYAWVGNYQNKLCTVRDQQGNYFHVDMHGERLYPANHLYAGDFRDGIAVVRLRNGLCTHIDLQGLYIHGNLFNDLDVYHKDFAQARDDKGWFHVDRKGEAIYLDRFFQIEPFYNGYALVHRFNGEIGILNEDGDWVHPITRLKGG